MKQQQQQQQEEEEEQQQQQQQRPLVFLTHHWYKHVLNRIARLNRQVLPELKEMAEDASKGG